MRIVIQTEDFHMKLVLPNWLLTGRLSVLILSKVLDKQGSKAATKFTASKKMQSDVTMEGTKNQESFSMDKKEVTIVTSVNKPNQCTSENQIEMISRQQLKCILYELRKVAKQHKNLPLVEVETSDVTKVFVTL